MAFFSKVGNILKLSTSKQIASQFSASNPWIYQAMRCMSSSKLFIGGLPYTLDDTSLRETFARYGEVVEAKVIIDRETSNSRGFGFVTFASTEEASSAIQALDGQDLQGRKVTVNYATERQPRQFGGGGGYGDGGYGGGGSGGYGGGGYGGSGGSSYGGGGGGYGGGQNYGGGGEYGGGQNYGGGGGYGGGQNYGGGGYGGGQNYGGAPTSGYGGGAPSGGYGGGATGGGVPSYGGTGSNVTADTGFASSGFGEGSGLGFGGGDQLSSNANDTNAAGDGHIRGGFESSEPVEGNYQDNDEFAKRA